ncbi:methionyl-tRNA formyltransferase [Saxibacter everestensis]|uniref:Methionyl-tRNA formyltransferase n=1 Tax=Saxibacter everestensis TaxID=2909229 RepID=A0ABY8QXP1_9MICO|nr:methionyl-tRNA formyltransferase [Brevibacteriaceae bacterium ZFBP1038]
MRLIFAGTPEVALPSLNVLAESAHDVVAVLTRPDAPVGRKRILTASPVKARAIELGIPVVEASRLRGDVLDALAGFRPDAVPIVAYGAIVGPRALAIAPWLNLHFSLLPRWRGAAPVQRAIMAGDSETGVSVFQLDEGLDTGPVLGTSRAAISDQDTAGALLERLAVDGAGLLLESLTQLAAGTATPSEQPAGGTHAAKVVSADAQIHWQDTAEQIDRTIRGTTPAPGAWTLLAGERCKIAPVTVRSDAGPIVPGRIVADSSEVLVGTGTHPVRLGKVNPPGKGWMTAIDWMRGGGAQAFDTDGGLATDAALATDTDTEETR